MPQDLDIGWLGLLLSGLLVLITILVSRWQRLGLESKILLGVVRTVVQLVAAGYLLGWILNDAAPGWTVVAVGFQLMFALWTSGSLLSRPLKKGSLMVLAALGPTYLLIITVILVLVIKPQPFWNPRFLLPLGGMLLGNSLSGIALALNRYRAMVSANRDLIMARLSLAASWQQAVEDERRQAAQAAMLPTVSAMLTVGVVALPGMMTGQIIAGADPVIAVKYQIVVMFMIASASAIAVLIVLNLMSRRKYFEVEAEEETG